MNLPIKIVIQNIDELYKYRLKNFNQHFYGLRTIIFFLIHLGLGIFFVVQGIMEDYDSKTITWEGGEEEVTLYNYHISLGIGIGLILYCFLYFLDVWKSFKANKNCYTSQLKKLKSGDFLEYIFTEEKIYSHSSVVEWSAKWSHFDSFKIIDNYLRLYSNAHHKTYPEFIIPLNTLSDNEVNELRTHLESVISTN